MTRVFALVGAAAYFLWGALHLLAAVNSFQFAASVDPSLIQGRLFQGASYVGVFAIIAVIVALALNWRNSRLGYWINLITVSVADIPFVLFIVQPGHMTGVEALLGPALWLTGAAFSTAAIVMANR